MFRRPRLPLRITLLLWLVLIITALNAVRLITAIFWGRTLQPYISLPGVYYVAISGGVWTLAGLLVLGSFWRRARYTHLVFLAGAVCYTSWLWADRLLLQSAPSANWPFMLAGTIVLLGYTAAVVLDPRNRAYFRKESYERKPEESASS